MHEVLATLALRALSNRTERAVGHPLNVGNVEENPESISEVLGGDSREPVELLARVLAHIFHRTPGIRTVEKRLEGKDTKSGPLSDLLALIVQLMERNKHLANDFVEAADNLRSKKTTPGAGNVTPMEAHREAV